MPNIKTSSVIIVVIVLIALGLSTWFFFFRSTATTPANNTGNNFGVPTDNTNNTNNAGSSNGTRQTGTSGQVSQQKIFQITPGPVVGATLIQTLHPTTTLARYIKQEDGHVFDLPLDVAGAVPRTVSNVTIPGGVRAVWVEEGRAAVMQYLDGETVKTVYLGFPTATTSAGTLPTRIQFLPDAIVDIAASPDGKSVTYLLKTASGVDGYIAKPDGTAGKKVFSLPLSQVIISWPSQGTLMAQTKSAAGVSGMVFSVDVKTGATTPLVYAQGLTAVANGTFSKVMYQTAQSNPNSRSTYVHDVKTGTDGALSFDPSPEKCLWASTVTSSMYCATSLSYVPPNYLDLWHQGAAGLVDSLFLFNITTGQSVVVATPGSQDGGVQSDILEMALSPNERYLSFTTKGARTLWGVRLSQ